MLSYLKETTKTYDKMQLSLTTYLETEMAAVTGKLFRLPKFC